jgi:cytochrome c oxidase cbb3-type subunit 3
VSGEGGFSAAERAAWLRLSRTPGVGPVTIADLMRRFDSASAALGAGLFAENCAACHMEDGSGNRDLGAPNLIDAIWLYGGAREQVTESVYNARFGVMPPWADKLSEDEIRAVATYVHSLGGGE